MDKTTPINLGDYSDVLVSVSGGKDSQTILGVMFEMARAQSYGGNLRAIHADTGAEWRESLLHCQMLCDHYGIDLDVALPHRALPAHIERRCAMMAVQEPRGKPGWPSPDQRYCTSDCKRGAIEKMVRTGIPAAGKPGWPSASCRYCTSHCKTGAIDKVVRTQHPAASSTGRSVLSVTGERRQESSHRAKLAAVEHNKRLSAGNRTVTQFRPILDYLLTDVWAYISGTGLPRHVAYDRGNERLSCAICMLAKDGDICRGAEARPDLAEHYLRIEAQYGFTMKNGKSLAAILAAGQEASSCMRDMCTA